MRFIFDNKDKVAESTFDEIIKSRVASNVLTCVICFEDLDPEKGDVYTVPTCTHSFHEDCIRKWKREKATCPFCRGPLPEELGETGGSVVSMDIDNSVELLRRFLEIVQEMERNQLDQSPWWKEGLVNFFMCPVGILLPPTLLLLLWTFETIALTLVLVLLPVLYVRMRIDQDSGCNISQLPCMFLLFLIYPLFMVMSMIFFLVFQVFYSIILTIEFYLDVLRCRRRWKDAYEYIVQGSIAFLKDRIDATL